MTQESEIDLILCSEHLTIPNSPNILKEQEEVGNKQLMLSEEETGLLIFCSPLIDNSYRALLCPWRYALKKKADKFESKKLEVHKVIKDKVDVLGPLLEDIYTNRRPKPTDYVARRDLIRVFNEIAKEIYGNSKNTPVVVEFGSFVMDLFSTTSDIDLSVNFGSDGVEVPREKKIQTLRKFAKKLYSLQSKGHVSGVLPITTAKVPILKCIDRGTGVECDISVENRDGISKSQIIHSITTIDERFHKLSFLMKNWAKGNNINSSKDKTLNSLSIILLVAFHLQTRSPPILPPFSAILKDGTDPASVVKLLPKFANYGRGNKESVAELFVTLLIKLSSIEILWAKGLCSSTCSATWISKTWDSKVGCISVEDFTDQSQNVSHAVGQAEVKQIYKCINLSICHVFAFMEGQITGDRLKDLLFGQDGIPNCIPPSLPQTKQSKKDKRRNQALSLDPALQNKIVPSKKVRVAEPWVPSVRWGASVQVAVGTKPSSEGWGTQLPSGASWGVSQQPSGAGWGTQLPRGASWGVSQQPSGDGWGRAQASSLGGWGASQQPSGGGCGRIQPSSFGGWGVSQQPSGGGWSGPSQVSHLGGWGGTHQSSGGGWGGTQQTSQQPSANGWVATQQTSQQPSVNGWGATEQTSQQSRVSGWGGSQSLSGGVWGETRVPSGRGWGGGTW